MREKTELRIRNVDGAVMAKLSQLAKKKNMSRNSYVKKYIESLSVLESLKELDDKYQKLLIEAIQCIEKNNSLMENLLNKENNNE